MKKFVRVLSLSLFFSLFITFSAFAQAFTAQVNRTEVPQGETFVLTLELTGAQTQDVPDLNVLDNDFIIYSVANAYQSKYINGTSSQSRQWQVAMMPKNSGAVTIPSIRLDNMETQPIVINVVPASVPGAANTSASGNYSAPSSAGRPRFAINAEVDNSKPFVQQQINYTLTLYDTGGLQGETPQFIDDGQNNWLIKSLGQPTVGSKVVNGRSIREIKFYYALFPQKSGVLKTPEVQFNGYYLTRSRGGSDPFEDLFGGSLMGAGIGFSDMFATRNPVVLTADPVTVDVQPAPSGTGQWWLPASKVTLYSEWEPATPAFKVGEAVSRTIYVKAVGVAENQLPDLKFEQVAGMKQYPDKAVSTSAVEDGNVVAVKKLTNVYIPNRPGKLTLPEISLNWFNTNTRQMEKAVLPPVTVQVQPGAASTGITPAPQPQVQPSETPAPLPAPSADMQPAQPSAPAAAAAALTWSPLMVSIGIGVAFLLGLLVSYLMLRRHHPKREEDKGNARKRVIKAANQKDLRKLRDALIFWAREHYGDEKIANLKDVMNYTKSKDFTRQLEILVTGMYSDAKIDFEPDVFVDVFKRINKSRGRSGEEAHPLPKLYK